MAQDKRRLCQMVAQFRILPVDDVCVLFCHFRLCICEQDLVVSEIQNELTFVCGIYELLRTLVCMDVRVWPLMVVLGHLWCHRRQSAFLQCGTRIFSSILCWPETVEMCGALEASCPFSCTIVTGFITFVVKSFLLCVEEDVKHLGFYTIPYSVVSGQILWFTVAWD